MRLSANKIVALILSAVILWVTVTYLVSPRWSFSVTTDKTAYRFGENVFITVFLENVGLLTQSFESSISDPVVVSIQKEGSQVWYSQFHFNTTHFSLGSREKIERNFVWNQSSIYSWVGIEPGAYYVIAFIPKGELISDISDWLFRASTTIDITST